MSFFRRGLAWAAPLLVAASATFACDAAAQSTDSFVVAEARRGVADRFWPAPAGTRGFIVPTASVSSELATGAAVNVGYARDPIVVLSPDGVQQSRVIGDQATLYAGASVDFLQRFSFDLHAPFTVTSSGDETSSPSGAAAGDLRIGGRAVLLGADGYTPGISLGLWTWMPSGHVDSYMSTGSVRFAPTLLVGADGERVSYGAMLARRQQTDSDGFDGAFGSDIVLGARVTVYVADIGLGAELYGSTVVDEGVSAFSEQTSHVELVGSAGYSLGPVRVTLGGGPGLTAGVGTPSYRLLAGVGFWYEVVAAPKPVAVDPALQLRHWTAPDHRTAPSADNDHDGDGLPDATDPCPHHVGSTGCPADSDGDGIANDVDRCPNTSGQASHYDSRHGCPLDQDGDGIADGVDACPNSSGASSPDPKENGCPASVRILGEQIVLRDTVQFTTGSADLSNDNPVLGQLVTLLQEHPEIARVAVDGHTDDVGGDQHNLDLARRRGFTIVRWLIDHGIDERRLEVRAFGARRPLVSDTSPEGRAINRRVEFHILLRTPLGERGWRDGPVHGN